MKIFILYILILVISSNLFAQKADSSNLFAQKADSSNLKYHRLWGTNYEIAIPENYFLFRPQELKSNVFFICNKDSTESSLYGGICIGRDTKTKVDKGACTLVQSNNGKVLDTPVQWKILNCNNILSVEETFLIDRDEIFAFVNNENPEQINLFLKIFESLTIHKE